MAAHRIGTSVEATIAVALMRDPKIRAAVEYIWAESIRYVTGLCGTTTPSELPVIDWDQAIDGIRTDGQIGGAG